jgi:hypothetical protein
MLRIVPDIDKKFILSRLSQEEIFERYLGVTVDFTEKICSPFREDKNPTCTFKRNPNGVMTFIDWSGDFLGNCFDVVMRLYGVNFWDACKIIARDFGLVDGLKVGNLKRKPRVHEIQEKEVADISVKWRTLKQHDVAYWKSYGICVNTMQKYKVAPVQYAWVGDRLVYTYNAQDPCYGYYFDGAIKLYFPLRKEWRFLGNFVGLQGYKQLPGSGNLLVITKSMKDVMFLYQCGIAAVAPPSESTIISKDEHYEFSQRFDTLVSLYDDDLTGRRSAGRMAELYDIPELYLSSHGGKDITDIAKNRCSTAAEIIIKILTSGYTRSRET